MLIDAARLAIRLGCGFVILALVIPALFFIGAVATLIMLED